MEKTYKIIWWNNLVSIAPNCETVKGETARDALIADLKKNPHLTIVVK